MAEPFVTPYETEVSSWDFAQMAHEYIQAVFPGWVPNPSNIDDALIQGNALLTQELATLTREVSVEAFTGFASQLLGIDRIVASKASGVATLTAADTLGHTIPAGTQIGLRTSGGDLIAFETMSSVVIASGSTTTTGVNIVAVEAGASASGLTGAAEIITPLDALASATVTTITVGGADDEDVDTYTERLVRRLRVYAPRPILPADFAEIALDTDGVARVMVRDLYQPLNNLLTVNQSSVETDLSGFSTTQANTTTTRQPSGGQQGNALIRSAATATGTTAMSTAIGAAGTAVTAGLRYTAAMSVRASAACTLTPQIAWFTVAGALISTSAATGVALTAGGAWQQVSVTALAPATAAFASIGYSVTSIAAAAYTEADALLLREGSALTWAVGGTAPTNNARMVAIAALDESGLEVSPAVLAALAADLNAKREVNFVVNTMSPEIYNVAVAATVVTLNHTDQATVLADVKSAVELAFGRTQWGSDNNAHTWRYLTKLRLSEVSEVINRVQGVDFVQTLTLNGSAADVLLAGGAPLVVATATVTAGTETP